MLILGFILNSLLLSYSVGRLTSNRLAKSAAAIAILLKHRLIFLITGRSLSWWLAIWPTKPDMANINITIIFSLPVLNPCQVRLSGLILAAASSTTPFKPPLECDIRHPCQLGYLVCTIIFFIHKALISQGDVIFACHLIAEQISN